MPSDRQKQSKALKTLKSFFNKKGKKNTQNYNDLVSDFEKKVKSK